MKKLSYRIIISGIKEDIEALCKHIGITDPEYIKVVRQKVDDYKGYQVFAAWLYIRDVEPESYVVALNKYVKARQLDPSKIKVTKDAVSINDNVFRDKIELTEYIHATFPIMQVEQKKENEEVKSEDPVIVNKDNSIKIYEVNSADDGRRLVGDDTSWCIGYKGPSNMWQGYRDTKESSFFIVFDNNPPTPDQRKVAIDFTFRGVELTDIPNRTGTRLTNGMDWDAYSNYLKSRGINLEAKRVNPTTGQEEKILQNKPVSPEEKIQKATFSTVNMTSARILEKNTVMLWQSGKCEIYTGTLKRNFLVEHVFPKDPKQTYLQYPDDRTDFMITIDNPDAIYYTARWMSQGKPFTDEILTFLMKSVGGEDVLSKFLNSGAEVQDSQYKIIRENKSLWKTYIRTQIIKAEQTGYYTLPFEYFKDLMNSGNDKLITYYLSLGLNASREFDVKLLRDEFPNYLKLLLMSSMGENKSNQFPPSVQQIIVDTKDKEIIQKFVQVATNVTPDIASQIQSDPELFLFYSKANLAKPGRNAFFGELGNKMVDAVLRSGDREAVKKAALGRGFEYRDFALAKEMGVYDEAKLSILNPNIVDPDIYQLYDPSNPYDVSLVEQIQDVDVLSYLYPEWRSNSKVSMANAIINFENRPHSQEKPIPDSIDELMLYLINDSDYMAFISQYELSESEQNKLKSLYSELQNSLSNPEFVKTFFTNFQLIKGNTPGINRMFSMIYTNVSDVLNILPSEALSIPEVKEYIEEYIEDIKFESLIKHIDVPWLYEEFVESCAKDQDLLRQKFNDLYNKDKEFAFHFLGDCFEKQKPDLGYFIAIPVNVKIKVASIYFEIYPDEKESEETLKNNFFDSLLMNKGNRSSITEQLYILRNFPKLFYYKIVHGQLMLRYIYPEIRSALRQMYPNIANLILQYETVTKYGSDYFDENTEEVVRGKRPDEVEPEQQDTFYDGPSEEDWPKQASIKLMVKVAQKLDSKKKYKLADKFTNILRKYNVQ